MKLNNWKCELLVLGGMGDPQAKCRDGKRGKIMKEVKYPRCHLNVKCDVTVEIKQRIANTMKRMPCNMPTPLTADGKSNPYFKGIATPSNKT